MHAYGVATHRHAPEIEQGLGDALGKSVIVNFTPHLMPMSRGIFEAIYVRLAPGKTAADCKAKLVETYKVRSFVLALLKHHA
jgi:N-acetyl-gamma-glutamyl-phosphate reductase